jgi:hypothetical protein
MTDTFEFTLNSPLTEEQWDMITDVDFDRTDRISFHTKHGKEVEFTRVIRCKDCKHRVLIDKAWRCLYSDFIVPEHYCGYAERKE